MAAEERLIHTGNAALFTRYLFPAALSGDALLPERTYDRAYSFAVDLRPPDGIQPAGTAADVAKIFFFFVKACLAGMDDRRGYYVVLAYPFYI